MRIQRCSMILVALIVAALVTDAVAAAPKKIDFNNDTYPDLAIGSHGATINGDFKAGSVTVIYGTPTGVNGTTQIWHQDLSSVPGSATTYDFFGYALATGDFNRDGFTDLAIGDPDWTQSGYGTVFILHGWHNGIKGSATYCTNPCWPQPIVLTMSSPQVADHFGYELVAADFNSDGFDDLAVGAPDYDHSGKISAGAVQVFYGGSNSLTASASAVFTLATPGISKEPESNDQFGLDLAAGNFGKSGSADLAIGMNKYSLGGGVTVIYGGTEDLYPYQYIEVGFNGVGGGNQFWSQSTLGFTYDQNDFFGSSLAAGDFGNSTYDDLAIGAPGRNVYGHENAGVVYVLTGSEFGLAGPYRQWTLGDFAALGLWSEDQDWFGGALTAGNIGHDGRAELVIGIPYRTVNGMTKAGAAGILIGTANGLSTVNAKFIHMGSLAAKNVFFGNSLLIGNFGGDSYLDLALGVPYADVGSLVDAGGVHIRYGSPSGPSITTSNVLFMPGVPQSGANFGYALPDGGN